MLTFPKEAPPSGDDSETQKFSFGSGRVSVIIPIRISFSVSPAGKTPRFLNFPISMFVPSLSWYIDRFQSKNGSENKRVVRTVLKDKVAFLCNVVLPRERHAVARSESDGNPPSRAVSVHRKRERFFEFLSQ